MSGRSPETSPSRSASGSPKRPLLSVAERNRRAPLLRGVEPHAGSKAKREREALVPALVTAQLNDVLVRRHGDLLRAWRADLDRADKFKLQFNEFVQGLNNAGFHGNSKVLWHALTGCE